MKNVNKAKLAKNAIAALVLGGIGLASPAKADPTPPVPASNKTVKSGVSMAELEQVTRGLQISVDADRKLQVSGLILARCLRPQPDVKKFNSPNGKHVISIVLPGCQDSLEIRDDDEFVQINGKLSGLKLDDRTGNLVLRHQKAGLTRGDTNALSDEDLADKRVVSSADLADAARREDELSRRNQINDLATRIDRLCKSGDMAGVGAAIEGARDLLGDVSDLLEKANKGQQEKFKKQLADARTASAVKEVLDAYREAAAQYGWDETALDLPAIEKRFALVTRMVEDLKTDSELKSPVVAREIESLRRDMRELDRDIYRRKLNDIAVLYGDLYAFEADKGNTDKAMEYAARAREFANAEGKDKMDAAMIQSYAAAFKACVKKNPEKMASCEKRFADKGQAIADRVREALANKADRSDEAMEEYQAFQEKYVATFGQGPVYNWNGYGRSTPYSPGAFEQYKQQALQQYQMNMYQRMMGGGMGAGRSPLF